MPSAGDRYLMPDGSEYLLVTSHDEAAGEYVEMEFTLPPGSFAPPAHRHPTQVEEYEVLDGSFDVMVDDEWGRLETGQKASVPIDTDHTFRTIPGVTVRVRNFHRPGGHFDEFIAEQHAFVSSDRFKGMKHPSTAIAMSMAWQRHADLLYASNPLLRIVMRGLARLGRLTGHRANAN